MSLSCSCDFYPSDFDTWWEGYSNFKPFEAKKRKRCCSCNNLIDIGSDVVEFYRFRHIKSDIEERIYGDERVPLANYVMCEECSGLFMALDDLGYGCLDVTQPMKDYVAEYNSMREELKEI